MGYPMLESENWLEVPEAVEADQPMEQPMETALLTPSNRRRRSSLPVRTALCVLLCVGALACKYFHPAGTELLQQWVLGTGKEPLQVAVNALESSLSEGAPVEEAVSAFCAELANDAAPD